MREVLVALRTAARAGDLDVVLAVAQACASPGALVAVAEQSAALHIAAEADRADVLAVILLRMQRLSEGSADHAVRAILSRRDAWGRTPMDTARTARSMAAARLLDWFLGDAAEAPATIYPKTWQGWILRTRHGIEDLAHHLPFVSFLVSLCCAFYFSIHFWIDDSSQGALHMAWQHMLSLASQALAWVSFLLTYCIDPGRIAPPACDYGDLLGQLVSSIEGHRGARSRHVFCHICRSRRPLRTGHSLATQRCIPLFDHYCTFLASDIGRDNHRAFLAFLAAMALLAMPQLLRLSARFLKARTGDSDYDSSVWLLACKGFTAWTFFVWLFICYLLCYHAHLHWRGLTTRELRAGAAALPYLTQPTLMADGARCDVYVDLLPPSPSLTPAAR